MIDSKSLILEWQATAKAAKEMAAKEMELRKQIAAMYFPSPKEGTQRFELGQGYKLKLVHKLNYTLAGNEEVEEALATLRKTDNEGAFIADRIIGWTPKLMVKEYKDADEKYRKTLERVLTIKDASPTLELEVPEDK